MSAEAAVPHRRLNQLTDEWVLVSPHRTARPWLGQVESAETEPSLEHDPGCYLCPGNRRAGGAKNPRYESTFVFDNDFPALVPDAVGSRGDPTAVLRAEPERGICRVLCYSPRHDLAFGDMDLDATHRVVDAWAEQYAELGKIDWVRNVQIFENRGTMMGASNPHPHGQIWANETIPNEVAKESSRQELFAADGGCLLCRYIESEMTAGQRVVCENEAFVVVVPYWAVWPYETLVLPRAHHGDLGSLTTEDRRALGTVLRQLTRRYDRLFDVAFPYSMGIHQRPTDGAEHPGWHLHAHVYPPLLRSATVRKFMVGYEMLAQPQRDLTPEEAAGRLAKIEDD